MNSKEIDSYFKDNGFAMKSTRGCTMIYAKDNVEIRLNRCRGSIEATITTGFYFFRSETGEVLEKLMNKLNNSNLI